MLDVRDLATGHLIASMPCRCDDAATTVACLTGLFRAFGPPLVLKADNGREFTAQAVRDLLERERVALLLSPVYMPQYNGACEAGHGAIKARAEALARRDGTPGQWSANHLEAARVWINWQISPTRTMAPQDRWKSRQPLAGRLRDAFIAAIDRDVERRRLEIATQIERGVGGNRIDVDALHRHAIVAALVGAGYLEFWSRPIRQPIPWFSRGFRSEHSRRRQDGEQDHCASGGTHLVHMKYGRPTQ